MFVRWVYIMTVTPTPTKSAFIELELAHLSIEICALSVTWLTRTGSIREYHCTFFCSCYSDGSRPRHCSGFAVRNSLLPCMDNRRLQSHPVSRLYGLGQGFSTCGSWAGHSLLVGHRGTYDGSQTGITELECIFQVEPINRNVLSYKRQNTLTFVIIC